MFILILALHIKFYYIIRHFLQILIVGGYMKELLIGMGIGFVVGAVVCKVNKHIKKTI